MWDNMISLWPFVCYVRYYDFCLTFCMLCEIIWFLFDLLFAMWDNMISVWPFVCYVRYYDFCLIFCLQCEILLFLFDLLFAMWDIMISVWPFVWIVLHRSSMKLQLVQQPVTSVVRVCPSPGWADDWTWVSDEDTLGAHFACGISSSNNLWVLPHGGEVF